MTERCLPLDSDGLHNDRPTQSAYVGILLAAGTGSRYLAAAGSKAAPSDHKLLARLPDGRLVAQASAQALLSVVPETIAIVTDGLPTIAARLSDAGCEIVQIPASPRGMGISLAAAARYLIDRHMTPASANDRHAGASLNAGIETNTRVEPAPPAPLNSCVVALADMPWIRASTLERLLAHAAPDRIVAPVYKGQRGHPVVFGADFLPELASLEADTGARAILARYGALDIECDDAGVIHDVDVPADLAFNDKSII